MGKTGFVAKGLIINTVLDPFIDKSDTNVIVMDLFDSSILLGRSPAKIIKRQRTHAN